MTTSTSNIVKEFFLLSKSEQVQLVQLLVSYLASETHEKKEDKIDLLSEDLHYTYQSSISVLAKDWDQPEDDHWDNY